MSRFYSAEERAARRRNSSKLSSVNRMSSGRYRLGPESLRISSLKTASETSTKRFSNEDETYSIDPNTGLPVMHSIEAMQRKRWDREKEDDSLKFDPDGTSEEQRQQNYEWAIKMCTEQVGQQQQHVVVVVEQQDKSCSAAEEDPETYTKCDPPPTQPLPPLDQLNLDQNPTTNPRELGFLPPSLPHSFLDIVPKLSRDRVGGISDGELVYGTYEEGIESCDPNTRIVYCVNAREDNCGCLLRCPRSASLVRCPKCNTVSPAGPELLGDK